MPAVISNPRIGDTAFANRREATRNVKKTKRYENAPYPPIPRVALGQPLRKEFPTRVINGDLFITSGFDFEAAVIDTRSEPGARYLQLDNDCELTWPSLSELAWGQVPLNVQVSTIGRRFQTSQDYTGGLRFEYNQLLGNICQILQIELSLPLSVTDREKSRMRCLVLAIETPRILDDPSEVYLALNDTRFHSFHETKKRWLATVTLVKDTKLWMRRFVGKIISSKADLDVYRLIINGVSAKHLVRRGLMYKFDETAVKNISADRDWNYHDMENRIGHLSHGTEPESPPYSPQSPSPSPEKKPVASIDRQNDPSASSNRQSQSEEYSPSKLFVTVFRAGNIEENEEDDCEEDKITYPRAGELQYPLTHD